MTLSDPRPALAEHSSLVSYLMGVAATTHAIEALARDPNSAATIASAATDDFVHLLLGVASLGRAIEHLVDPSPLCVADPATSAPQRWLR